MYSHVDTEWLGLYNNSLNGTIPENMNLPSMYYLDLGHNNLAGPVPNGWFDTMVNLKILYLDHNDFAGGLPQDWSNPQLSHFIVNDNQFTGEVPSRFDSQNLTTVQVQNNAFTSIKNELCQQSIFVQGNGKIVTLGADCDICGCETLCDQCSAGSE